MSTMLTYFIVILFSNTIGALSGMGGGIIIKPALDAVGAHNLASINFYSSVAVFVMSIVSVLKQVHGGFQIKIPQTLSIASGSVVGGLLGSIFFQQLLGYFNNQDFVQLIQIFLTVLSLGFVLLFLYLNIPSYHLKNLNWIFGIGLFLGFLSTLLGIGGGPINVLMLMICFSMPMKQAAVYSIVTIFFSQLSKLTAIALKEGFAFYDLNVFWVIIPAAIMGGVLGSKLNQQLSEDKVNFFYRLVTVGVIILNLFNGALLVL